MGQITLKQAAQWCGGSVDPKYENVTFFGANIDSRNIKPGELFVALKGVRDGHDYISKALEKGAAAVLCQHADGDFPAIVVKDSRIALGDIARGERNRLGAKVVGITGSVGKSTTKEMIACVLEGTYRVGKSMVNYNNDLGLPMSVLALPDDTQVAVLEMGMNHFREMAYLTSIAQPNVAVIINIGTMHIENLGSIEGILKAKLEILEGMKEEDTLIFNGDDQLLWNVHKQQKVAPVYFGVSNQACKVRADHISFTPDGIGFDVCWDGPDFRVELPVEGEHFVADALAAVTVGLNLNVSPENIQKNLAAFANMEGRQEIFEAKGCTIIKDCYNAGPESMTAALTVLGNRKGRRVAVLGDMLELGSCSQAEHYRIGRIAAEKTDLVLAYGANAPRVIGGAITGGMDRSHALAYEDRDSMAKALLRLYKPGDVILFKGSHSMRMDLVLDAFLAENKENI